MFRAEFAAMSDSAQAPRLLDDAQRARLAQIGDRLAAGHALFSRLAAHLIEFAPTDGTLGEFSAKLELATPEVERRFSLARDAHAESDSGSLDDLALAIPALVASVTQWRLWAQPVASRTARFGERAPLVEQVDALEWMNAALMFDRQWLDRLVASQTLGPIPAADKMKLHRARKRAGFTMTTIPVHETELESLEYLGFLAKGDRDPGAVADAVTAWHQLGFAVLDFNRALPPASPSRRNLDPDPVAFGRLKPWPVSRWMIRFSRLIESVGKARRT